jgi:hypothetical protein
MLKAVQGLTPVPNILVLSAGSFKSIRFSISRHAITHLIQSSGNPSFKIANFQEYMEAGWSGSMRNSNLIHSDLSASCLLTFSTFFTWETKEIGRVGGKLVEYLENLLMAIVWIDLAQQKCDHSALCWEDKRNLWSMTYHRVWIKKIILNQTNIKII